jgi:ligand-binding sensor domain-containing protein
MVAGMSTPPATTALRSPRTARAGVFGACASLLLLLSATPAWCMWQTFGLADGLPTVKILGITQDTSENVWFVNADNGVTRYDGATFRSFLPSDGLLSQQALCILGDRQGRVWIGTLNNGVSVFDGAGWNAYTDITGNADNSVNSIYQDPSGAMWFATNSGAVRFDGAAWTSVRQGDGLASDKVNCVFEDRLGVLWFGTESGLSRYDGATWSTFTSTNNPGFRDNWIECILQTRDGALWVGTRYGGLSRFDGSSWSRVPVAGNLAPEVTALREDRFGALWVATSSGLARWSGQEWRTYGPADGLSSINLTALTIDVSGSVWIGTEDRGVVRFDCENWTSWTNNGLGSGVQGVFEDRDGVVWAATAGSGAARFDRAEWTTLTSDSGLASNQVTSVVQDAAGAMWFGTSAGASRRNSDGWRTFTVASDILAGNNVTALARDSSNAVWIGTTLGLSRYDGVAMKTYTIANGLPASRVRSLLVDRDGSLWCGTNGGLAHLRDTTWTRYTTADGLAHNNVSAILQDHGGVLWFGTSAGLTRFDGTTWRTFTKTDGLGADAVLALAETPDSVLWVGTSLGGVSRFDGDLWHTYSVGDGLISSIAIAATVERSGSLWFGTPTGLSQYDPARVPPQTVVTSPPLPLSPNRLQTVQFAAGYRQVVGIEYATSFDNDPWSLWTTDYTWVGRDLRDGVHTLRIRTRDALHHEDPTPAVATFEIAATPPTPVITLPRFRDAIRDTLVVHGTATATRFRSFRVDLRASGATSWDPPVATLLAQSSTPLTNAVLAQTSTSWLPDGDYELRLSVQDTLGLVGITTLTFIVDNVAPYAAQTSPALVSALDGGEVYTTNREAHVYLPPRALSRDATVRLDPLDAGSVPASLPDGATRIATGFAVHIDANEGANSSPVPLDKAAVLDLAVTGDVPPPGTRLSLYFAGADSVWRPLGGTVDPASARISTPFNAPGSYALFAAPAGAAVPATGPLKLTLTPRVLSSRGAIANSSVRIGFVLERSASVRVTIHNRAGRLVREVMSGQTLGAGTNLVSWDGRDEDRHEVDSGLYLVSVEALGETHTQTLAVLR